MSRIGERKLVIPEGVTVDVNENIVTIKGAKGELSLNVNPMITVSVSDGVVLTKQKNISKEANVYQGTTNSLINNMLIGVSNGFSKSL